MYFFAFLSNTLHHLAFGVLMNVCFPLLTEPTETEKMDTDSDSQPDKVRYGPATSSRMCSYCVMFRVWLESDQKWLFPCTVGIPCTAPFYSLCLHIESSSSKLIFYIVICTSTSFAFCLFHVVWLASFPISSVAGGVKGWSREAQRVCRKADRDREGKEWDYREIWATGRRREWGRRIQDSRYRLWQPQ